MGISPFPETQPEGNPFQRVPDNKKEPSHFWHDGTDLVAPQQGATLRGRCLITGKEFSGDTTRELQELRATWLPGDRPSIFDLPLAIINLWISGRRGSITLPVHPAWRIWRILFVTGMLACLSAGVLMTLVFTFPTLLLKTLPLSLGLGELFSILTVIAGPSLLGMFVIGLVAGVPFHIPLRVVKISRSYMWIRGAHADALFGLPPWQLSPFAASEHPLPVYARIQLRESDLATNPIAELQAPPHRSSRGIFALPGGNSVHTLFSGGNRSPGVGE